LEPKIIPSLPLPKPLGKEGEKKLPWKQKKTESKSLSFYVCCAKSVDNHLVHAGSVCNKSFKKSLCFHGVLNAAHVDIPLANNVYVNGAVVENSAPEGLLYGYGENTGENGRSFLLVQNAASDNNSVVVEGDAFIFDVDDLPNHNNEGNDEEGKQNVPPANNAPSTLFHYVIGFRCVSHGKNPP
jgi:hypothetical protein